ncbi:hypothetical protein [Kingella potus]|nr:hypothetical protein [Kingella potus]UOP01194.1 hypothetical protein LVJ84_02485 [Kingella potus]
MKPPFSDGLKRRINKHMQNKGRLKTGSRARADPFPPHRKEQTNEP